MPAKPNILYIHSHDTGRYIQPYGHAVPTPALQKLAEEGVLFRQNFCINPTCSPSRAALLVGNYPHENGMLGLAHRGFQLHDYRQHVLHTLRKAGYVSALAGTQHIAANSEDSPGWKTIGYDRHLGHDPHAGALEFFKNPPQEPFFLAVGFGQTHRAFPSLEAAPDDPRYCLPPAPLPDTAATRADMTRYKASARRLDTMIGEIMEALQRSGCAENTLVICTTDHGIAFPRMKCILQDSGIGVFLIMRGPAGFSGGQVVDGITSHLDIYPTICEVVGIEPPPWLRGKSLLPFVCTHPVEQIHEALFSEVNYHAAYEPMRAVRTPHWKYIKRFSGRETPVLVNCDRGESKSVWLDAGWAERPVEPEALYDLVFDPNEMNNLVSDPDHTMVLDEMRTRMQRWMQETHDPLLQGAVAAPEGAKVNDTDDIHV